MPPRPNSTSRRYGPNHSSVTRSPEPPSTLGRCPRVTPSIWRASGCEPRSPGGEFVRGELRHPRLVDHDLAGLTVVDVVSVGKHLFTRLDDGRSLPATSAWTARGTSTGPGWRGVALPTRRGPCWPPTSAWPSGSHCTTWSCCRRRRNTGSSVTLGPDLLDPAWSDAHATEALRRLRPRGTSTRAGAAGAMVTAGIGNLYKPRRASCAGLPVDADPRRARPGQADRAAPAAVRNADRPEQTTTANWAGGVSMDSSGPGSAAVAAARGSARRRRAKAYSACRLLVSDVPAGFGAGPEPAGRELTSTSRALRPRRRGARSPQGAKLAAWVRRCRAASGC